MRRDLSMVRKLEKIEKEMGYCSIKMEKESRLETQVAFLKQHKKGLLEANEHFSEEAEGEDAEGNRLGSLGFSALHERIFLLRDADLHEKTQAKFVALGAKELFKHQQEFVERLQGEIEDRLQSFCAFADKKQSLTTEQRETLSLFNLAESDGIEELSEEFQGIEECWNILTEDVMNMEQAVFQVERGIDYLNSARDFVLKSRSEFAIDQWRHEGYLIDLFKHSSLGRAKEMIEGADRNMKLALLELVCVEDVVIHPEDFVQFSLPFMEAMFEDLFVNSKFIQSLDIIDSRIECARQLHDKLSKKYEDKLAKQFEQEENRGQLFARMGNERRRLSLHPN